ncbi:hypothetical protein L873DRAFT_1808063 [Choiromyces venosus 120613-1]|uniref:HTH psq-type domain-containing protein n=1 Tax=Choiromyces venosus 120613-1 TaxID=1336337 RepID=A0A3N4JJM7_9PEZI|nr:hypothetical protein L873DRAFT_1808063 [Choiromyces venosus 120613-1]
MPKRAVGAGLKKHDSVNKKHQPRIALAIQAFQKGNYPSITAKAQAFDLPKSTLTYQLNCERQQLLILGEEKAIVHWVKKLDDWGFPPWLNMVKGMA